MVCRNKSIPTRRCLRRTGSLAAFSIVGGWLSALRALAVLVAGSPLAQIAGRRLLWLAGRGGGLPRLGRSWSRVECGGTGVRAGVCLGLALVGVGLRGPSVALASAGMTFASPALIDSQPPFSFPLSHLNGVSCPSASLCVAVDWSGDVVTSTDPTAATPTWTIINVDGRYHQLLGVSCPSTSLCVAGDGGGNVVTSTDPSAATPRLDGRPRRQRPQPGRRVVPVRVVVRRG